MFQRQEQLRSEPQATATLWNRPSQTLVQEDPIITDIFKF